jgi:hypothetical protein
MYRLFVSSVYCSLLLLIVLCTYQSLDMSTYLSTYLSHVYVDQLVYRLIDHNI